MINADDIKKATLMSTREEWAHQCSILGEIAAIDLASYRSVLAAVDAAAKDLPGISWVQDRLAAAKEAAVNGWAYH